MQYGIPCIQVTNYIHLNIKKKAKKGVMINYSNNILDLQNNLCVFGNLEVGLFIPF